MLDFDFAGFCFPTEQKTGAEERGLGTGTWLGCMSVSEGLLSQNDSVVSLGMEGKCDLPQSHWVLKAKISPRTLGSGD